MFDGLVYAVDFAQRLLYQLGWKNEENNKRIDPLSVIARNILRYFFINRTTLDLLPAQA